MPLDDDTETLRSFKKRLPQLLADALSSEPQCPWLSSQCGGLWLEVHRHRKTIEMNFAVVAELVKQLTERRGPDAGHQP